MKILGPKFRRYLFAGLIVLIALMSVGYGQAADYVTATGDTTGSADVTVPTTAADAASLGTAALDATKKLIGDMETNIAAISKGGNFNALGKEIVAILGTVVIIWSILKNWILKPGITQLVADLVFPFIVIFLCFKIGRASCRERV